MKVEYCVAPNVDVFIDDNSDIPEKIRLDGADIYLEINENNLLLKTIKVVFTGLPIKLEKRMGRDDVINQNYPEINKKAFKIISYLFNRVQGQTGQKAVDKSILKDIQPDVTPETVEEITNWKKLAKTVYFPFVQNIEMIGVVDFADYEEKFISDKAYANFTDAKNTDDPVSKYERLYKVVESFFSGRGDKFDQKVADFMVQFDTNFMPDNFGELRKLRNRCVHSKDKKHVTSGDLELLSEVASKSEKLERIADLLLKHK